MPWMAAACRPPQFMSMSELAERGHCAEQLFMDSHEEEVAGSLLQLCRKAQMVF